MKNRLKLNYNISHFMVITSSQRRTHHETEFCLNLGLSEVTSSSEERVLGIQIGNSLASWKVQIDFSSRGVIPKCSKKLAGLKLVGKYLSFKKRRVTGQSVVLSRLFYCVEVWGPGLTLTQLRALQACMNRLTRWITQNPVGTSVSQDLMECGFLSVNQTIVFRVLITGLLALKYGKPVGIRELLKPTQHGFNTRGSQAQVCTVIESYYSNKSWKNKFVKYLNKLPEPLKYSDMKNKVEKDELKS